MKKKKTYLTRLGLGSSMVNISMTSKFKLRDYVANIFPGSSVVFEISAFVNISQINKFGRKFDPFAVWSKVNLGSLFE